MAVCARAHSLSAQWTDRANEAIARIRGGACARRVKRNVSDETLFGETPRGETEPADFGIDFVMVARVVSETIRIANRGSSLAQN